MKVPVAGDHVDDGRRLHQPLSHGGENCPLILVRPVPFRTTCQRRVNELAVDVEPESKIRVKQASGLKLVEIVHHHFSHPHLASPEPDLHILNPSGCVPREPTTRDCSIHLIP